MLAPLYVSDEVKHLVLNSKNVKIAGSDDITKQNLKLETLNCNSILTAIILVCSGRFNI